MVESVEYHKHMSQEIQAALKSNNRITTQYIRTRADRIAVHKETGITFQVEFKTHLSRRSDNMMIQALPLAIHLWNSELGIKCLYVYDDPVAGVERGFWTDSKYRPAVKRLRFTQKKDIPKEEMCRIFEKAFPEVKRYSSDSENWGQPYVIVDYEEVRKLPDWRSLVLELIQSA